MGVVGYRARMRGGSRTIFAWLLCFYGQKISEARG